MTTWMGLHSVDVVFAAVIVAWFAYLVRLTAHGWFFLDDWGLIEQGGSFEGMVQPFNKHLSVVILAIYRSLAELFGLDYGPFRTTGLICLLAVPVTFYATTRRYLGPPLAAIASLSMLAFTNHELRPATLNHYLMAVGAIWCAAALNRGRTAWLVAGLCLSLGSAGGGLAVAVACLVHSAVTRAQARRWVAVLVPLALYGAWLLATADSGRSQLDPEVTPTQAIDTASRLAWTPFQHLGFDVPALSVVLLAAFVGYGVLRLRQGLDAAANLLAWSAALTAWSVGLGTTRGADALVNGYWQLGEIVYRYQLLTLVMVFLALVPRQPLTWRIAVDPRWRTAAAGMLLLAGWAGAAAIDDHVEARAAAYERKGWEMKAVLAEVEDGIVNRYPPPGVAFYLLDADVVLSLLDRYGHPAEASIPLPSRPTIVDARAGDAHATLTWTTPTSDGGSDIIGYKVTPYIGFEPQAPTTFDSAATSQVVDDLTNGETYRFKVQAINAIGLSGFSEASPPVTPS